MRFSGTIWLIASIAVLVWVTVIGATLIITPQPSLVVPRGWFLVSLAGIALLVLVSSARAISDQRRLRRLLEERHASERTLEERVAERTRDFQRAATERQHAMVAEVEQREFAEGLRDVVLAVANSEDLRTALQAVVAAVRRCGPIAASGVMFVEDGVATTVAHDGYVERGLGAWVDALAVPIDRHPGLSRLFHLGEIVVQNQAQDLPEWRTYAEVSWVGSYIGVPLRVRGHTYGFINVVAEQRDAFTEIHSQRLAAIASSIALALENARLFARTRRRAERLGLLIEVGANLNRAGDTNEALTRTLHAFGEATDCGALVICGGEDPAGWSALATYGLAQASSGWSLPRDVVETSGLLASEWSFIRDPLDDLRLTEPALQPLRSIAQAHGRRMLLAVPLTSQEHRHGMLLAFADREFSSAEAEQMRLLGAIIATRIEVDARLQAERLARASAEEASRMKGEFLANTSHELRTPLTGIMLGLELATDGTVTDETERGDLLGIAHQSAARLLAMINGLLDLAKIEAGRLEVHPERIDLLVVVQAVVNALRPGAEKRGLYLTVSGWTSDTVAWAWADPAAVHQILTNLIGNAVKFTDEGGVTVSLAANEGRVAVSVADTGLGIKSEQLTGFGINCLKSVTIIESFIRRISPIVNPSAVIILNIATRSKTSGIRLTF